MYVFQFYHSNTGLKASYMCVNTNHSIGLSRQSLWGNDLTYFEIITNRLSCFTWTCLLMQLVFYKSPWSFSAPILEILFMILLIILPLFVETLKPPHVSLFYSAHFSLNSSSYLSWYLTSFIFAQLLWITNNIGYL